MPPVPPVRELPTLSAVWRCGLASRLSASRPGADPELTMASASERATLPVHGAASLPSVTIDSYNLEIEDDDGFLGDKASRSAFWDTLGALRKKLKSVGEDPFG